MQRGVACIPKSVTPSRIQQNLQVFDFSLSYDDMKLISSFDRNQRFIIPTVEVRRRRSSWTHWRHHMAEMLNINLIYIPPHFFFSF